MTILDWSSNAVRSHASGNREAPDECVEMYEFFRRGRWPNIIGHVGASFIAVGLGWECTGRANLLCFLVVHQLLVAWMAWTFTSRWTTSRRDRFGIPKFARSAVVMALGFCGSLMFFDLKAAEDLTFALVSIAVAFACVAGTMVTLGPVKRLARPGLFALLVPQTLACLCVGHYVIAIGSVFFLVLVAIFGLNEMHAAYSELVQLRNRSTVQSHRDNLTQLLNRRGLEQCYERSGPFRAVCYIDLDRYKQINDQAGHHAGDQALREVASRLTECCGEESVVCRLGGDEFFVLLREDRFAESCELSAFADSLIEEIERPLEMEAGTFNISASVGIVELENDECLDAVLRKSDHAMYRAKKLGRQQSVLFCADFETELDRRSELERQLKACIGRGEFAVHGQPIYRLSSNSMFAVEFLARPEFENGFCSSPDEFIPILEELDLLNEATRIILRQAAVTREAWKQIPELADTAISINVSARSLACDWLLDETKALIDQHGLTPGELIFEITEGEIVADIERSREALRVLQNLGVFFALDDFGTGYSSLSQLLQLPLSLVKIDKSIIQKLNREANNRLMRAIYDVAAILGHCVIAEGIESPEHASAAEVAGASYGQGYFLGRPVPLSQIVASVAAAKQLS